MVAVGFKSCCRVVVKMCGYNVITWCAHGVNNNTILLRFGSVAICGGVGSGNNYIQVTSGYFRVYIY